MSYAGLDYPTAYEDLERIETGFGAAMSAHPVNHITAGDIDSSKMIEGLDPKTATIADCRDAVEILQKHCVLKTGDYGKRGFSIYQNANAVVVQYHNGLNDHTSREQIAFDLGKLEAGMPRLSANFDRYSRAGDFGGVSQASALIVKTPGYLAIGINALAEAAGKDILAEITAIQAEKSAART